MTPVTNSFDILNPESGRSAINELLHALVEGLEATLTLRSTSQEDEGAGAFPLGVTKLLRLELDNAGLLLFTGETALGGITGRLMLTNSAGKVGRVTIATEGVPQ